MKPKVLLVEDDKLQIDIILESLGDFYDFYMVKSVQDAKAVLSSVPIEVILLDVMLPDGDGFSLNQWINDAIATETVIIYITSLDDIDYILKGFKLGASDYVIKPYDIKELKMRMDLHLSLNKNREHLAKENRSLLTEIEAKAKELEKTKLATFLAVTTLLDRKHGNIMSDFFRMRFVIRLISEKLMEDPEYHDELTENYIDNLCDASALHDIGMIAVPDELVRKTSKLSDEEYEVIKSHTVNGVEAIEDVEALVGELPFVEIAKECVHYHHERWDGKGYPIGLSGHDIPLASRIMALVDVYEALISKRNYRQAFTHEEALKIIASASGQFDPKVIWAFCEIEGKLKTFTGR